jgi:hypothetical protein
MAKLKLDLHDIFNKGLLIDNELDRIIKEAVEKKDHVSGNHPLERGAVNSRKKSSDF